MFVWTKPQYLQLYTEHYRSCKHSHQSQVKFRSHIIKNFWINIHTIFQC